MERLFHPEAEQRVAVGAHVMVGFLELEPGNLDGMLQFFETVHLGVAVRDAGKVERGRLQGVCGGFEALLVPERFQHVHVGLGRCGGPDLGENARDFFEREAVEELAHPHGVGTFGESGRLVEYVAGNGVDAAFESGGLRILLGDGR